MLGFMNVFIFSSNVIISNMVCVKREELYDIPVQCNNEAANIPAGHVTMIIIHCHYSLVKPAQSFALAVSN